MTQSQPSRLKQALNPISWIHGLLLFIRLFPRLMKKIYVFTPLFFLLFFYMIYRLYTLLAAIPLLGWPLKKLYPYIWSKRLIRTAEAIIAKTETKRINEAHRMYLIRMADKNLSTKKARTIITILGMSIGIAIIVFLLSVGYGVEKLVISQVASLDELKIIDVSSSANTSLKLNQDTVRKIKGITNVKQAIPIISFVGRVSLNQSNTDVLVYGAPNSYFELTGIPVSRGGVYKSNKMTFDNIDSAVAGAKIELKDVKINSTIHPGEKIQFNIIPELDATVWDICSTQGKILGYVPRLEGGFEGSEVWGSEYYPYEDQGRSGRDREKAQFAGEWVQASVPLYTKGGDDMFRPEFENSGMQKWVDGCIQSKFIQVVQKINTQSVLGESTVAEDVLASEIELASSSAELSPPVDINSASDSGILDFEEFSATLAAETKKDEVLSFKGDITKEAVVSSGFLEIMGIDAQKAVETNFEVSFIIMNTILSDVSGRAFTEKVRYKIVGVIDDLESPYFYVPLEDVMALGPVTFSQLKVEVTDEQHVASVRRNIETLGFTTNSTLDTVEQIQSLFNNLRILLGLLGLVALGVASLGMFNTLTVSLLERTREIGGMKTMGMVSDEIEDLFLAEAMIMGVAGGVGGLVLGYIIGKGVSLGVSIISISRGQGFLDLTHIPFFLIAFILVSSFMVGLATGIIPAYRAKRISALNALRYE
ncbi:MAG TPA: ABC transporter permease [Candidatus Levybacteria bacterium]|nr:ABC transporter permease [Candidatus Levybacteria bacterium]